MKEVPVQRTVVLVVALYCLGPLTWCPVSGYNILIMAPFGSYSHVLVFDAIAEALADAGHQVTAYTWYPHAKNVSGVTTVHLPLAEDCFQRTSFSFFTGSMLNPSTLRLMRSLIADIRNATYASPEVRRLLSLEGAPTSSSGRPFDVLVVDSVFNEFVLPIGHLLDIPAIYVSPGIVYTPILWNLQVPVPYAYVTSGLDRLPSGGHMTFVQRGVNALTNLALNWLRNHVLFADHDAFLQTALRGAARAPSLPPIRHLERNVSFVMAHTHPAVHRSAPSMPYVAEIACIHCRPGKKLPQDLYQFLEESGPHGTIFFSLGSYTRGDTMPPEFRSKLLQAFAQLPQTILFKYETDLEGLPGNVRMTKWAPQQDLLAHPNLRLFMTHGGGHSILEAVYHACPVLVIPLSADQLGHAAHATRQGFGEAVDWTTVTVEELLAKIRRLLSDKRYQDKVQHVSELLKDQEVSPRQRAVYWIEYVARHRGALHLKSQAGDLHLVQYFLLDVLAAVALGLLLISGLAYVLLKTCIRLVVRLGLKRPGRTSPKGPKKHKSQ